LQKEILKEQMPENRQKNFGILGQSMDLYRKDYIKQPSLDGELIKRIYLQMQILLIMAQNVQFI